MTFPLWSRLLVLLLIGLSIFLVGRKLRVAQVEAKKNGALFIFFGFCLLAVWLPNTIAQRTSAKRTQSGEATNVHLRSTRNGQHIEFDMTQRDGSRASFVLYDTKVPIQNGQEIVVTYLDFPRDLRNIQIISGSQAGYEWRSNDSEFLSLFPIICGLVLIVLGLIVRARAA